MFRLPITAKIIALTAATGLVAACGSGTTAPDGSSSSTTGCSNSAAVAKWPLQRRLAQLLMGGAQTDQGEDSVRAAVNAIAKGKVGGVNFLGSDPSVYSENQLAEAVDAGGEVPPFLAVDEEGGRVQRLVGIADDLPSARQMADTKSPGQVKRAATKIGNTMAKLSLNMDLAPVVDVSDQPDDAVIGDRSFSDDPATVTEYAGAFADGLRAAGVIPVLKHFPGLGSGSGNTDTEPATTPPLKKLENTDLVPYKTLLNAKPVAVMLTNAAVPGLTKGEPATLSTATYDLLRTRYGFTGVVMTDSLSAAAITDTMSVPKAVEVAIRAGADIALWDDLANADSILKRLQEAVAKGRLSESRVTESVVRVLDLKGVDLCVGR